MNSMNSKKYILRCSRQELQIDLNIASTDSSEKIIVELFEKAIKGREDIVITARKNYDDFLGVSECVIGYNIQRAENAGCNVKIVDSPYVFIVVGRNRFWLRSKGRKAEASFNNKSVGGYLADEGNRLLRATKSN